MSRFTLKDDGLPYKKIMQGRKWIGRVYQHAETKKWAALINTTKGREEVSDCISAADAFHKAVARACGFSSPAAMDNHNADVRAANRASKMRAQHAMSEYYNGNFDPLFNMITGGQVKVRP